MYVEIGVVKLLMSRSKHVATLHLPLKGGE